MNCPRFVAFPNGGLPTPNLIWLCLFNCVNLKSLPKNMHTHLLSLLNLFIDNCPEVESFPDGALHSNLQKISKDKSDKLISNRKEWGLQRMHSLKILSMVIVGMWSHFQMRGYCPLI